MDQGMTHLLSYKSNNKKICLWDPVMKSFSFALVARKTFGKGVVDDLNVWRFWQTVTMSNDNYLLPSE